MPRLFARLMQRGRDIQENAARPSNDFTFETFARRWLATEKAHVAINTRAMYENVIEKHLNPDIGSLYFSEITQADLQGILDDNFEKAETCVKILLTLRQIYSAARDAEIFIPHGVNIKKLIAPKKVKNEKTVSEDLISNYEKEVDKLLAKLIETVDKLCKEKEADVMAV